MTGSISKCGRYGVKWVGQSIKSLIVVLYSFRCYHIYAVLEKKCVSHTDPIARECITVNR